MVDNKIVLMVLLRKWEQRLLHNYHYVVLFCSNTAEVRGIGSAACVFLRSPSCKSSLYSHCCVRGYPPGARYPFESYKRFWQTGAAGYAERLSSRSRRRSGTAFSYRSIYWTCQADSRFSSRKRGRFFFFAPADTD